METTTKKWYQSKTIWGIAIAALGFIINHFFGVSDLNIPENADFETIQRHIEAFKNAQGSMVQIVSELMAAVGTLLAIFGRMRAQGKLTK
jgi:hypothetical protein